MSDQETVLTLSMPSRTARERSVSTWTFARSAAPAPRSVPSTTANVTRNTTRPIAPTSSEPLQTPQHRGGQALGRLAGARDFDPAGFEEWKDIFYSCTTCRRCAQFCPFGIDNSVITRKGRTILDGLGRTRARCRRWSRPP